MCFINNSKVIDVASFLRKIKIEPDSFDDELFYPPKNSDKELVARYFFFMVAIDHRTSRPGRNFEGYVDGKFYHGADLLYRLGARKFKEDPEFFSPENMAKIEEGKLIEWLSPDEPSGLTVPDPKVRVMLLRDAGEKLVKYYNGRLLALIEGSKEYLYTDNRDGLIDRLKIFKAYEDPVEKKAFLLVKFLLRREIINLKDFDKLQLPVDNHLSRIAFRLGLVKLIEVPREEASWEEDVAIRMSIRGAYKQLAKSSGISEDILDDFLWVHGRTCCIYGKPRCDNCRNPTIKIENCPLREVCEGYKTKNYMNEHSFLNTWYY